MDIGMLWFDNDPKTDLPHKVVRAADYYREKYGRTPNLCLVNPNMIPKETPPECAVEVKPNQHILFNHLWIGVAAEKEGHSGQ